MDKLVMGKLFDAYHEQCPKAKIRYSVYDYVKKVGIIMLEDNIEIVHFYDGSIKFIFSRGEGSDDFFTEEYNTYDEAAKNLDITEQDWQDRIKDNL